MNEDPVPSSSPLPRPPDQPAPPGQPQRGPYVLRCDAGKYAWCRCRRSATFPLCDGTHRGSDVTPLKIVLEEATTVAWCCCGHTRNPPFCDGSHARLS